MARNSSKGDFLSALALAILLLASVAATDSTNSAPGTAAPAEKTKVCFQCKGAGKIKCTVPSCKNGQADCPGPCLKLSKGVWIHMHVDGHPPEDVWQKFEGTGGKWSAWSQAHVGEVIQMQNGEPVNIGKCTICGGTGHVKCSLCKGTGEIVCPICEGKKVVPQSWTAFDNPKLKDRPTKFKLKDGTTIIGRRRISAGDIVTIRTETGDVNVVAKDIISEEKPPAAK